MTELVEKKVVITPKLKRLQKNAYLLYKEGINYEGYVEYLNKKIQKEIEFYDKNRIDKFYWYKDLSNEEIEYLKNTFRRIYNFNEKNKKNKYENIKFRNKQKKNYNKKKNELIESCRIKRLCDLKRLTKDKNNNTKSYSEWSICYNSLHQYNRVVPNANSRESLRNIIFNKTEKPLKNTDWQVSRSKFYYDINDRKKYYNKEDYESHNTLQEYDYICWKKFN